MSVGQASFVWVAGHSCAGKLHFIRTVIADVQQWTSKLGLGVVENAAWIGDKPISEIEELRKSHDCIFIHWQSRGDSKVRELKVRQPDAKHVVVHVNREIEEHKQAFARDYPTHDFDAGHYLNVTRVEAHRVFADLFVDVANIAGRFYVVGQTEKQ